MTMVETERETIDKNDRQTQSKNVMEWVEKVDIPADVDRRMEEVMENMDE
jgi:hypothetical protein